jgi:hypothetical protein
MPGPRGTLQKRRFPATLLASRPPTCAATDEPEIVGGELFTPADRTSVQVLGKRLARFRMFGQPVAGLRGQRLGERVEILFEFEILIEHGLIE